MPVKNRGWTAYRAAARTTERGSIMVVSVALKANDGALRDYEYRWVRQPVDPEYDANGGRAWRWTYTASDGSEAWKADYGYGGRLWGLYGPHGVPFGHTLDTNIRASLIEASTYIAMGEADDADDRTAVGAAGNRMATKRERHRLAMAELVLGVAGSYAVTDPGNGEDIARKYNLTQDDMKQIYEAIGARLEAWAVRLGYERTWDDEAGSKAAPR